MHRARHISRSLQVPPSNLVRIGKTATALRLVAITTLRDLIGVLRLQRSFGEHCFPFLSSGWPFFFVTFATLLAFFLSGGLDTVDPFLFSFSLFFFLTDYARQVSERFQPIASLPAAYAQLQNGPEQGERVTGGFDACLITGEAERDFRSNAVRERLRSLRSS